MCVKTTMLSSLKSSALLLLLLLALIATLFSLSAAMKLRHIHETTTIAIEAETLLPTITPKPTTTAKTTTKKLLQNISPSQQNIEDYAKSVKIFFPTNNDSDEESKFDVYGLKTTPPPTENEVKIDDKMATTEASVTATTNSTTDASNSVSNSTVKSIDDRLGILNLAPHCPDGFVVVNERCHKSA